MNCRKVLRRGIAVALILWLLAGCGAPEGVPASVPPDVDATATAVPPIATAAIATLIPPAVAPTLPPTVTLTTAPTATPRADGLTHEEAATLSSLEQMDDYPLYTMHYYGSYAERVASAEEAERGVNASRRVPNVMASLPTWGCSLFAAQGNADDMVYGRNFDWDYSPAVLVFTDPPDGYASVSMVDIAYFGFDGAQARGLTDLPLAERQALLDTPRMPFDGMNERGLVVGMAAVPPGQMVPDPNKETTGSLGVIRKMLDQAGNVDEAVAILSSYNIDFEGGPPVHYLIADPSGRAALVEFYQGEMVIFHNETPYHLATNFLRASAGASAEGQCRRYDKLSQRLRETEGQMTAQGAMDLLAAVSQEGTQWSVVYGMSSGDVSVTMGRGYDTAHTLHLSLASE
jgi:hypothetical protein